MNKYLILVQYKGETFTTLISTKDFPSAQKMAETLYGSNNKEMSWVIQEVE